MPEGLLDLSRARILLSNDDGIEANGLKVLERIARTLSDDVWVVAPETEQSAASHSLTLRVPLRIRALGPRRFAINGTPTDSVLLAVQHIMKDGPPDLVLSGVNRGGNLGEDVTYSGTIAAAMEGTLLGVPSIALSQHVGHGQRARWATAEHHAAAVIRKLAAIGWPKGVLLNVNFPDVPAEQVSGIVVASQGRRKLGGELERRLDPRGVPYYWIGTMRTEEPSRRGSDLAAINRGAISVTPLSLDLTHRQTMMRLREKLG
ncbi:MAG TPA: 5'/3'-nucleotidase SurE [Alphaproteobacteria bacterium]|nr:5'/3'-nucleotidase SurE [Alphaproteobacteria bacterium]